MNKIKDLLKVFTKDKCPWEKFYDKDERDVTVPDMSLFEYLYECNKDHMNLVALNYFNKKMTYKELFNQIDLCARALRSQGIRPGDVVTICMPNTPEAVISFYAVNKIGAIANMIHPLSAEEEIKQSLLATKSVMLIAINLAYSKIENIIGQTQVYKVIIISAADSMPKGLKLGYNLTQGRKILTPKKSEKFLYWHEFMEKGKKYYEDVLVKTTKDQDAVILHSGGTTGTPKNIVLTNGNINVVVEQGHVIFPDVNTEDVALLILPLFHCFGLVATMHCPLCFGASVVLIPQFDARKFDKLITKYHPTYISGVPTLYEALVSNKKMANVDLSFVKNIYSAGDSLNPEKQAKINNFLKEHNCQKEIMQGYGMTETSGPVCFGSHGSGLPGSIGIPLPGDIIKIVDVNTKEELPYGEVGEILVTGPTVMKGYLDNEKETNEVLEKDEKGRIWVHTGDLAYMTEDGVVFFAQRLKRMLIVSGYNVYPSHIEEVLLKHPDVLNCGVIGIPHPYKVQVPKAYIVLKPEVKVTPKVKSDIKEYCEKNLARYMLPKEYVFKESLPKTMIGKVDYRELEKENEQEKNNE